MNDFYFISTSFMLSFETQFIVSNDSYNFA